MLLKGKLLPQSMLRLLEGTFLSYSFNNSVQIRLKKKRRKKRAGGQKSPKKVSRIIWMATNRLFSKPYDETENFEKVKMWVIIQSFTWI